MAANSAVTISTKLASSLEFFISSRWLCVYWWLVSKSRIDLNIRECTSLHRLSNSWATLIKLVVYSFLTTSWATDARKRIFLLSFQTKRMKLFTTLLSSSSLRDVTLGLSTDLKYSMSWSFDNENSFFNFYLNKGEARRPSHEIRFVALIVSILRIRSVSSRLIFGTGGK